MKYHTKRLLFFIALCLLAARPAAAALSAVGPTSPVNGFPVWYQDANGLQIELGLDPQFNLFDPPIVGNAFSEQIGFGAEGFYWIAENLVPLASGGNFFYRAALEYAFLNEDPADGDQMVFGRLRFRMEAPVPGTYTITHPYGVDEFIVDAPGPGPDINSTTDDILTQGNPPLFSLLDTRVDTFLVAVNPAPPAGFVGGNAVTTQTVTGSPFGTNFLRVDGPNGSNIGGPGIDFVQTDQFMVMAKVFGGNIPPFASDDAVATEEEVAVQASVLANDLEIDGTLDVASVVIVTPPADGLATANLDGTVSYTPNAGFTGEDSFTYTVADNLGMVSSAATVTVTVNGPTCGNGLLQTGEQCDDGNSANGDGCSSTCQIESCGDGVVNNNGAEQCDDGNTGPGDGCNAACQDEICGDGIVNDNGAEACDDGNTGPGDGCDAACQIEPPPVIESLPPDGGDGGTPAGEPGTPGDDSPSTPEGTPAGGPDSAGDDSGSDGTSGPSAGGGCSLIPER